MSQFPTGATTYSPASLTEQERTDFRTEMDVYSKSESVKDPSIMNSGEKETFRTNMGVAKTNGDVSEIFKALLFSLRNAENTYSYNLECVANTLTAKNNDDIVRMTLDSIGNMNISGSYTPFTGTHIAISKEELETGELVSLHSLTLDDKQPLWEANYCVASKKGVYGVVYDKQDDKYLIACVGDAIVNFSNENGSCEAGDYLIPSATKKGCVMSHKGDFVPLNQCGKAGEATNENKLIAWVKE